MNQTSFPWGGSQESRAARDEGIQQVTTHNEDWHTHALKQLGQLVGSGRTMTGEEIKAWLLVRMNAPKHVNAWGALIRSACIHGMIEDTGMVRLCENKQSHARRTPLWQFKL